MFTVYYTFHVYDFVFDNYKVRITRICLLRFHTSRDKNIVFESYLQYFFHLRVFNLNESDRLLIHINALLVRNRKTILKQNPQPCEVCNISKWVTLCRMSYRLLQIWRKITCCNNVDKNSRIINIIRVVARRYERSKRDVTLNVSTLIITASFKSCQKLAT